MRNHHALILTRTTEPPAQPADQLLQALADQLTAGGMDTRSPAWEDRGYLKITNTPGALSEITITTCGHLTWEYRPSHTTPARLAAIIIGLLDPDTGPAEAAEPHADLSTLSLAGRALARCGLSVTLDVLDISQAFYYIYSELRITNPARPERGTASLAPDGTIWWECRTAPDLTLDEIASAPHPCPHQFGLTRLSRPQPRRTSIARQQHGDNPPRTCPVRPCRGAVWPPACPNAAQPAGSAEADRSPTPWGPRQSGLPPLRQHSQGRQAARPKVADPSAGTAPGPCQAAPRAIVGLPTTTGA